MLDRLRDTALILNPLRELQHRRQEKTAAFSRGRAARGRRRAEARRRRRHPDGGARRINERYALRNIIS